jgi:hypothetical protein
MAQGAGVIPTLQRESHMKTGTTVLGAVLLALASLAASAADNVSYSYIDLNYVNTDLERGPSGDGFGVRGSVGFADNFFVFADYTTLDFDDVDADQYAVGLGGHMEMSEVIDLTGRLGYVEADLSAGGNGFDSDGYMASLGVRGRMDAFELEGQGIYRDFSDGGDEFALNVAGRYFFSANFAVGAEYEIGDDAQNFIVGIRFTF